MADFVMNFPPGVLAGLLLGWKPLPSVLLGDVTYISSSGIIAKVLADLGRLANPETAIVIWLWLFTCRSPGCCLRAVRRRPWFFPWLPF
jgi:CPA2 family monovalent cation:H+ antiporter-2